MERYDAIMQCSAVAAGRARAPVVLLGILVLATPLLVSACDQPAPVDAECPPTELRRMLLSVTDLVEKGGKIDNYQAVVPSALKLRHNDSVVRTYQVIPVGSSRRTAFSFCVQLSHAGTTWLWVMDEGDHELQQMLRAKLDVWTARELDSGER